MIPQKIDKSKIRRLYDKYDTSVVDAPEPEEEMATDTPQQEGTARYALARALTQLRAIINFPRKKQRASRRKNIILNLQSST